MKMTVRGVSAQCIIPIWKDVPHYLNRGHRHSPKQPAVSEAVRPDVRHGQQPVLRENGEDGTSVWGLGGQEACDGDRFRGHSVKKGPMLRGSKELGTSFHDRLSPRGCL